MAYFSNSTDGLVLDEQCENCIHEDPDAGCPIALVQQMYNYDQKGIPELEHAMSMLVGEDGMCKMKPYIDRLRCPRPKDTQLELF